MGEEAERYHAVLAEKNEREDELYVCRHDELYTKEAILHNFENCPDSTSRTPEKAAIHILQRWRNRN